MKKIVKDLEELADIADSLSKSFPALRPQWVRSGSVITDDQVSLVDQWRKYAKWIERQAKEAPSMEAYKSYLDQAEREIKHAVDYLNKWLKNYDKATRAAKKAKNAVSLIKKRSSGHVMRKK